MRLVVMEKIAYETRGFEHAQRIEHHRWGVPLSSQDCSSVHPLAFFCSSSHFHSSCSSFEAIVQKLEVRLSSSHDNNTGYAAAIKKFPVENMANSLRWTYSVLACSLAVLDSEAAVQKVVPEILLYKLARRD